MDLSAHFNESLAIGKTGETEIANWILSKGATILPIYEIADNQYKGPTIYTGGETIIAPDMLVMSNGNMFFVEAKHKAAFTEYRKTGKFQTGIDIKHLHEYIRIQNVTNIPVWLMFLQRGGIAKDSSPSPSGLYGGSLGRLYPIVDHFSDRHGISGMAYWNIEDLKFLSKYPLINKL